MTRWKRMFTIALPVCAATGIMFGFLPRTWIELRFGVDPDGGSGVFEFLVAAVPIVAGLCLAIRRITLYRNMTSQAAEKIGFGREKRTSAAEAVSQVLRLWHG
jgi:hypothetical protein